LIASYLEYLCPVDSVHALIQARDYTSAHELTGYHEAITQIRVLADEVDAVNEQAQAAAQRGNP